MAGKLKTLTDEGGIREYILIRLALDEAIDSVEATAACNLPPDPSHDNEEEKRLRTLCKDRAAEWKTLLHKLGGKATKEKSISEEFSRRERL